MTFKAGRIGLRSGRGKGGRVWWEGRIGEKSRENKTIKLTQLALG